MSNRSRNKKNWLRFFCDNPSNYSGLFAILFPLILVTALLLLVNPSFSQETGKTVTGVVRNNNGEPLPGVSVTIKGTSTASITGSDGIYSIRVPSERTTLVFSYVGMTSQEQPVTGKNAVNIILSTAAGGLDDVVVIGYGTVRKKDATGSVAKVNVTDMQKAPVRSFEEALAGRVAGVQVSSTDGQPGDALNIIIRGSNSVTGNNSPLYVIDGFPIESPNNNVLNPAEIESIDVLKDASATAIYGARGANGVIIITTKRGKPGPSVVTYNGYYGFSNVTKRMDVMSPYDFVGMQLEINPTLNTPIYLTGTKSLEDYRNINGTDFQNELFKRGAFSNHYLSITGGNTNTRYTISGSLTNQDGVVIASAFKRGQGRVTLDQTVSDKFKVGINTNYTYSESNGTTPRNQTSAIGGNDTRFNLLQNMWAYRPVTGNDSLDAAAALLNEFEDPGAILGDARVNPISSAKNEYNRRVNNTFVANVYAEYSLTKDLKLRVTGGANLSKGRNEVFNNSKTRGGSPLTSQGQANGINGSLAIIESNDYVNENALTYTKRFNRNHTLTALVDYSIQYNFSRTTGFSAIKVPNEGLGMSGLDEGTVSGTTSNSADYGLQSFLGRINYSLFNKYLFTASFRADGSSKFAPDGPNQYGYFPSGAFAWKLGEENFIKEIEAISSAKIRASYGVTGNNRIGPYDYLSRITTNTSNAYYTFGNTLTQGFNISALGNKDLKWESTGQFDLGLELGFFKDRILFEADVYRKRTYDLLLTTPIAPGSGFTSITANVGKTQNQGIEFSLNTINVKNKTFSWNSSFNIAFNHNKILALNGSADNIISIVGGQGNALANVPGYIAKVGKPISQMYGFVYAGNYQVNDFDVLPNGTYLLKDNVPNFAGSTSAVPRANQKPGDPRYADINGDGLVNDNDLTIIGDPNPIHIGGFTNNFAYKNFDLNVFLQWSYGNDVYNANRVEFEGGTPLGSGNTMNQYSTYNDRWTFNNPSNKYFRAFAIDGQYANGTRVTTSRVVEDASFLRLKTVQLGYNVSGRFIKKAGLKSLRAYASAQNIYTWTKYEGMDPEVNTKGTGLTAGYDFSAYPRAMTFTFGLNVTL